jgi:RimJ/RimL family protein N-acetyltransferase
MPGPHSVIHASRFDLVPMPPPLMRAILAEDWTTAGRLLGAQIPPDWRSGHWRWLGNRPDQAEADPSLIPWFPRVLLLRPPAERSGGGLTVVGEAGFQGPPDDEGRVEFGYMVISYHRRRGFAEEATRALTAWATRERGITRFRASIGPQNIPSLSLIRKLGFVQVGSYHHEELGEQLIFHRDEPLA